MGTAREDVAFVRIAGALCHAEISGHGGFHSVFEQMDRGPARDAVWHVRAGHHEGDERLQGASNRQGREAVGSRRPAYQPHTSVATTSTITVAARGVSR